MKKILSIILALGLVLSMSLAAMPAAAQTPAPCATIAPEDDCAGKTTTYTITFTSPVTLLAGNDILSFSFGAGTTFVTPAGAVTIDGPNMTGPIAVPPATVVRAAPDIQFVLPAGAYIAAGDSVIVVIDGVKNPAAGEYTMGLSYKFACCDPVLFCSTEYDIRPAVSTYKIVIDHGVVAGDFLGYPHDLADEPVSDFPDGIVPVSYPGIAQDFFPPTQYGVWNFWAFILDIDVEGCAGEEETFVRMTVTGPPGATMEFYLFGNNSTYDAPDNFFGWHGPEETDPFDPDEDPFEYVVGPIDLDLNDQSYFGGWNENPMLSRADMPGEYTICFELYKNIAGDCDDPTASEKELAKECYTHMEYQWLDAFGIELGPKWNLISLPLVPFDSSIESILEPLSLPGQLKSVWHYDRCEDGWFVHNPANNVTTLDDIEEARGYWFRMLKSDEKGFVLGGQTLWVFGTARPMPEFGPASYEICEGWTMLGFLPVWDRTGPTDFAMSAWDYDYLWNFENLLWTYDYGMIYGWDSVAQDWDVDPAGAAVLLPGNGYWVAFERDGTLYP